MVMKISMIKIMLLSITLLVSPFYVYNMAYASIHAGDESHENISYASEHFYISTEHAHPMNLGSSHCSSHSDSATNHQADGKCSTTCCISIVLISTSLQELNNVLPTSGYYNTFRQHAESINIDNQLRPPQYS